MRFSTTPEQELSRSALRELLRAQCTPSALRAAWTSDTGRIPGLWQRLAEIGLIGLLAPEAAGGAGLSEIELVLLLEETGRAALPEPVVEVAAVAVPLLAALPADERAARLLERTSAGDAAVAMAFEANPYVLGAETADTFIVERAAEIHLLPRAQVSLTPVVSVDRARRLSRVEYTTSNSTSIARGIVAKRLLAAAFDRAALATAAQLVGLGAQLIELTVEFVKTREQFGKPIGSFQTVKHQLVDAHLALAFARPLVERAAHSLATRDEASAVHVSSAKAFASEAAALAARKALQLHGAIGYSYEHDLHLWMKRVWALAAAFGDAAWHRDRVASSILGGRDA